MKSHQKQNHALQNIPERYRDIQQGIETWLLSYKTLEVESYSGSELTFVVPGKYLKQSHRLEVIWRLLVEMILLHFLQVAQKTRCNIFYSRFLSSHCSLRIHVPPIQ